MARRPPRPDGVAPNPRTKSKSEAESFNEALGACKSLASAAWTGVDNFQYLFQINADANDRTVAILYAVGLESSLDESILSRLHPERSKSLFRLSGALGSFANKIDIAFSMEILGPITKRNFDIIRNIRNVFAHARRPITFKTPEIVKLCKYLTIMNVHDTVFKNIYEFPDKNDHKQRYSDVCMIMSSKLFIATRGDNASTLP